MGTRASIHTPSRQRASVYTPLSLFFSLSLSRQRRRRVPVALRQSHPAPAVWLESANPNNSSPYTPSVDAPWAMSILTASTTVFIALLYGHQQRSAPWIPETRCETRRHDWLDAHVNCICGGSCSMSRQNIYPAKSSTSSPASRAAAIEYTSPSHDATRMLCDDPSLALSRKNALATCCKSLGMSRAKNTRHSPQ